MDIRYSLALAVILILMIAIPAIFIFQRRRFSGENLPLMKFKDLLGPSRKVYFLYAQHQCDSSDYLSAKELANVLTAYPLIEHSYQLGDSFVELNGYPRPERISSDEFVVLVGGPCAHACVKCYEDTKQAPLIQKWTDMHMWWETREGKIVDETFITRADLNERHDMFIVEFFKDKDGRNVLAYYGHNWQGTLVAGRYFSQVMYPKISNYEKSYYVFSWVDSNNDASPDVNEVIESN